METTTGKALAEHLSYLQQRFPGRVRLRVTCWRATTAEVKQVAELAVQSQVAELCLPASFLPVHDTPQLTITTLAGFPSGKHHALIKATEARFGVQCGAERIEVVPDYGAVREGNHNAVLGELIALREAITDQVPLRLHVEHTEIAPAELDVLAEAAFLAQLDALSLPADALTADALARLRQRLAADVAIQLVVRPDLSDADRRAQRLDELVAAAGSPYLSIEVPVSG